MYRFHKLTARVIPLLSNVKHSFLTRHHLSSASSFPHIPTSSPDTNGFLKVQSPSLGENVLRLSPLWLRDHCRCSECFNSTTFQRNLDILELPSNVEAKSYNLNGEMLEIQWSDGHQSSFEVPWLLNNTHEGKLLSQKNDQKVEKTLWDRSIVEELKLTPIFNDEMQDENVLMEVFRRVVKYGFAKIERVPPTVEGTQRVCQQITRLSNTFFGSLWENGTHFDHKDTGYLNGFLEAHNDNTYFTEAQGLMVFHCTEFNGVGGESLLVDGFHAAEQLNRLDPEAYQYLSNTVHHSEYIEPGEHFEAVGPILRHDPVNRQLEQIRFNIYDRAALSTIAQTDVEQYYRHLKSLASVVKRKENEYWFSLRPGTVLVFDNWRLLHGRAAYEGKRVINGCYFTRSDFMSRARHFKLV